MTLHCPRCQIAQAGENEACINCGQPLVSASTKPAASTSLVDPTLIAEADAAAYLADHDDPGLPDPVHDVQARRASWRLPALLAVGLLLALLASVLVAAKRRQAATGLPPVPAQAQIAETVSPAPTTSVPPASAPPTVPVMPSAETKAGVTNEARAAKTPRPAKTAAATPPLTVTLASASDGRHVKLGSVVTLTAFATVAHGQSAALTIFSRQGRAPKTMVAFGQGSLCSTIWTPQTPGRYDLTATALGERRQSAVSRRIRITVDSPAPPVRAPAPSLVTVAPPPASRLRRPVQEMAVHIRRPRAVLPVAARPASSLTYHVAAAQFPFLRNATVLADALSRRGYPAVPEPMPGRNGKTVYVVVTGSYRRPQDARKARLALQRSGYPAYLFGGR